MYDTLPWSPYVLLCEYKTPFMTARGLVLVRKERGLLLLIPAVQCYWLRNSFSHLKIWVSGKTVPVLSSVPNHWLKERRWKWLSHVQLLVTPWTVHGILQARILEWIAFPFSRGIFRIQGSNPVLPHCRWILYQLSHKGIPRTLEWVAYPFSKGSSGPKNSTGVSSIVGGFFTNWAIREAQITD